MDPSDAADDGEYPGSAGSAAAAQRWLRVVLEDGDISAAWPLTDQNLRLCLVQDSIWAKRETLAGAWPIEHLANGMAQAEPRLPGWTNMQCELLRILREMLKDALAFEGPGSLRPQPIDPVHQVVFVVNASESNVIPGGEQFGSVQFLMANRKGLWLVAGFCADAPKPGWPPIWPAKAQRDPPP